MSKKIKEKGEESYRPSKEVDYMLEKNIDEPSLPRNFSIAGVKEIDPLLWIDIFEYYSLKEKNTNNDGEIDIRDPKEMKKYKILEAEMKGISTIMAMSPGTQIVTHNLIRGFKGGDVRLQITEIPKRGPYSTGEGTIVLRQGEPYIITPEGETFPVAPPEFERRKKK